MKQKSNRPMFRTLIGWTDPNGTRHEPGEIAELDVFDLADLLSGGTIEPAPEQPSDVLTAPAEEPLP